MWGIVTSTGRSEINNNSHWELLPCFGEIVIKEERNDGDGNLGSGATSLAAQVWKLTQSPNQSEALKKKITIQRCISVITKEATAADL